ncbi:acetyltransferase [Candidatus Pseudothioglobus singularis]|nr:acetyltransferase [Candidatus Pseudothioglobus singularis]
MIKKIILIGAGGHAKSCIDVIDSTGEFSIAGFLDSNESLNEVMDIPIIGSDINLKDLRLKYKYAFITLGQIKNYRLRKKLFEKLLFYEYEIPILKSKYSIISKKSFIGKGSIVMHGAIVNCESEIGLNCIINSRSLVEHDVKIDNHAHIATGAILNGGVEIGEGTFVGSGTVVKQGVKIAENCVIGAGLFIKYDVSSGSVIKEQQ